VLSFDLSGKGGPTSSYATAGIALWIIAPRRPPYPAKDAFVKVESILFINIAQRTHKKNNEIFFNIFVFHVDFNKLSPGN
jgi:hypothetical protein